MIEIKCETVDERRKVTVRDGESLIYAVDAPLSGKPSEDKLDVALIIHTRNELRKRQARVDAAIIAKLEEMEVPRP